MSRFIRTASPSGAITTSRTLTSSASTTTTVTNQAKKGVLATPTLTASFLRGVSKSLNSSSSAVANLVKISGKSVITICALLGGIVKSGAKSLTLPSNVTGITAKALTVTKQITVAPSPTFLALVPGRTALILTASVSVGVSFGKAVVKKFITGVSSSALFTYIRTFLSSPAQVIASDAPVTVVKATDVLVTTVVASDFPVTAVSANDTAF